jgi:hypothetical protein
MKKTCPCQHQGHVIIDGAGTHSSDCPGCFKNKEAVDHPAHYGGADDPYEAIKVIEAWQLGFHLGNTVKYISRAGKKGDALEDLKKARWYLDRAIGQIERIKEFTR